MKSKLPIGYYLKKADNLLTEGINKIHHDLGINRLQWQILNSVHQTNGIAKEVILKTLVEFAKAETILNTLEEMEDQQWVELDDQKLILTEKGRALFEKCYERQKAFRLQSMKNITEEAYYQTIATLEQMIQNLQNNK